MISVFLIFLYMFITAASLGGALISLLIKKENIRFLHPEDAVMLGLMIVTVYAQIFSLFANVGLWANIILLGLCVVSLVAVRRKLPFKVLFSGLKKGPVIWCMLMLVIIVMVYGTSAGYMHYDSDLYHAQAIRWIEEYGVVKGLGNIHTRLAYNSSSFALAALYSFAWISGRSYHACAGFLALIVFVECLRIAPSIKARNLKVSDLVRAGAIYYIVNIYDEMVSPESDYFAFLMLFYITIRMVDLALEHCEDADIYAIFALIAICMATIKLSVAFAVLVCAVPILLLVKKKRYKKLLVYVSIGVITALPFFIRGVMLSGYLLFPSTMLNFFNVDWKVHEHMAKIDSDLIIAYGRGYESIEGAEYPFKIWFANWILKLGMFDKVLLLASILGIVYFFVSMDVRKKETVLHIVEFSLIVIFASWFLSAPLIRYAQGIMICFVSLMIGDVLGVLTHKENKVSKALAIGATVFTILIFAYKVVFLAGYICTSKLWKEYAINQQDYTSYEMISYELDGITFYTPTETDLTGYDPFPAVPYRNDTIKLRGESLKDGFRY